MFFGMTPVEKLGLVLGGLVSGGGQSQSQLCLLLLGTSDLASLAQFPDP